VLDGRRGLRVVQGLAAHRRLPVGVARRVAIIEPRQSVPIETSSPSGVTRPLWQAMQRSAVWNSGGRSRRRRRGAARSGEGQDRPRRPPGSLTSHRRVLRRTSPRAGRRRPRSRSADPSSGTRTPTFAITCCRRLRVTWTCGTRSHRALAPEARSRAPSTSSIGDQARPKTTLGEGPADGQPEDRLVVAGAVLEGHLEPRLGVQEGVGGEDLAVGEEPLGHRAPLAEALVLVAGRQPQLADGADDAAAGQIVVQHPLERHAEIAHAARPHPTSRGVGGDPLAPGEGGDDLDLVARSEALLVDQLAADGAAAPPVATVVVSTASSSG
jgi:hypothetical protein